MSSKYDLATKAEVEALRQECMAAVATVRDSCARFIEQERAARQDALANVHERVTDLDGATGRLWTKVKAARGAIVALEDRMPRARWARLVARFRAMFRDREAV